MVVSCVLQREIKPQLFSLAYILLLVKNHIELSSHGEFSERLRDGQAGNSLSPAPLLLTGEERRVPFQKFYSDGFSPLKAK